jgi:hypothetical protein
VDVIDLQENQLRTLPLFEVLRPDYPYLRYLASKRHGDAMQEILSLGSLDSLENLVLTFNPLTRDRNFLRLMRTALRRLEVTYETPVDIEFAVQIVPKYPHPEYKLQILQCRPLAMYQEGTGVEIPEELPEEDILFRTYELIPDGEARGIRYVVFVDPRRYRQIPDTATKQELGRVIGRLNHVLQEKAFVLIGPGRWGSSNIDLGVRVSYADIFNTRVLIEMSVAAGDGIPELSYGTHFFQDLIEGGIYSLPLHLENQDSLFSWAFFENATNQLAELSPQDAACARYLKVIDVAQERPGHLLDILMDGSQDVAVGYLRKGNVRFGDRQGTVSNF